MKSRSFTSTDAAEKFMSAAERSGYSAYILTLSTNDILVRYW